MGVCMGVYGCVCMCMGVWVCVYGWVFGCMCMGVWVWMGVCMDGRKRMPAAVTIALSIKCEKHSIGGVRHQLER